MTKEWVCVVEWVQATPTVGGYLWKLLLLDDGNPPVKRDSDTIILTQLAEGVASTKIGVYWQCFKACRKNGLRFRPNIQGSIPEKIDV